MSAKLARAAALAPLVLLAGCSLPVSGGGGTTPQTQLTVADGEAILGAAAILTQVPKPDAPAADNAKYVAGLTRTKANPKTPAVDVGVTGVTLADYTVDTKAPGSSPVCLITRPPAGSQPAPSQNEWVLYYLPAKDALPAAALVLPGVADCKAAATAAGQIAGSAEQRVRAGNSSARLIAQSAAVVPLTKATPRGLELIDMLRKSPAPSASQ